MIFKFNKTKPSKMTLQYRYSQKSPLDKIHAFFGRMRYSSFFKMTIIVCDKVCWIYTISVKEAPLVINGNHAVEGFFLSHTQTSAPEHCFFRGCVAIQKCFFQFTSLKVSSVLGIKLCFNLRSKESLKSQQLTLRKTGRIVFFSKASTHMKNSMAKNCEYH